MKTAYCICLNDSIEYVIIDDKDKAESQLIDLKDVHFKKNKWQYKDYEEYKAICFWHIHEVMCE